MSEAQLLTIDFLGIGIDKVHSSPQLPPAMHSTQSCLSKIKPHMLQQVLSLSHPCFGINPELSHTEVSESIKTTMELFPQHTTGFQSNGREEDVLDHQSKFSEEAAAIQLHLQPSPPTKPSSAQLANFYNGAMNVYGDVSKEKVSDNRTDSLIDEQAEAVIMLAARNGNSVRDTYPCSDQGASSTSLSNISKCLTLSEGLRAAGSPHSNGVEITQHTKIPIAKKLSLQRFLQKRKDRLNRVFPYTTSSK